MNMVQDLPDTYPTDEKMYFFKVIRKGWKDGEPQRIRLKFKRAKGLARLVDTEVSFDIDQSFPDVGECRPGTQKAFIYGTRKGK